MQANPLLLVIKTIVASAALVIVAANANSTVLSADLASQFYVPKSGHIVLELSWPRTVSGLQAATVDDVLKLHAALSASPLDDASIKNFAFLKVAGLALPPLRPFPPAPPGAKLINERPPEWVTFEMHIDGDSLRQVQKGNLGDRVFVHTSDSDVVVSNSVSSGQVNHGLSGTINNRRFDLLTLFTRSSRRYSQDGWQEVAGSPQRRFRRTNGVASGWIIAAPDSDYILASIIARNATVSSFSLHLRPRRLAAPRTYFVPELTCEFQKTPEAWRFVSYHIQRVELDVPIDAEHFKVPLEQGNVYVATTGDDVKVRSLKVSKPITDITPLTPSAVVKTIRSSHEPLRPGVPRFAYCMGLVFLLAAGVWAYRAFFKSRPFA